MRNILLNFHHTWQLLQKKVNLTKQVVLLLYNNCNSHISFKNKNTNSVFHLVIEISTHQTVQCVFDCSYYDMMIIRRKLLRLTRLIVYIQKCMPRMQEHIANTNAQYINMHWITPVHITLNSLSDWPEDNYILISTFVSSFNHASLFSYNLDVNLTECILHNLREIRKLHKKNDADLVFFTINDYNRHCHLLLCPFTTHLQQRKQSIQILRQTNFLLTVSILDHLKPTSLT